jgi:O-methyltransferase involved in polyketide biosynthesis
MNHVTVHKDTVLSLVGRAEARVRFPELGFADPWAEAMLATLDVDPAGFDDVALRSSTVRTIVVDGLVRHYFDRNPDGLAVALSPGLCTRFSRVDNGSLRWVSLDPPSVAEFKRAHRIYQQAPDRHVIAACCSLSCTGWMDLLREARDVPTLVIAEGLSQQEPPGFIDALLTQISARLPRGTELVLDGDPHPARGAPPRSAARASLELTSADGASARYPRLRHVGESEYPPALARTLRGARRASRLFSDDARPSVFHLRFS